jgi:hypothetical protein
MHKSELLGILYRMSYKIVGDPLEAYFCFDFSKKNFQQISFSFNSVSRKQRIPVYEIWNFTESNYLSKKTDLKIILYLFISKLH